MDHSDSPPWKRLIRKSLTTRERVYLITTMFSEHNQVEIPERLSPTADAQTFIDMIDIDEVSLCTKGRMDPDSNFRPLSPVG